MECVRRVEITRLYQITPTQPLHYFWFCSILVNTIRRTPLPHPNTRTPDLAYCIYTNTMWLWLVLLVSVAAFKTTSTVSAPLPTPSTIIDILSADVQYSYFLRHLQRHGLVPEILLMQNVTVFAPVNSAFVDKELAINDTHDSLLRYFVPQPVEIGRLNDHDVVFGSMYNATEGKRFPLKISAFPDTGPNREFRVNDLAEIVDYDNYAKHQQLYIQGMDRLLPAVGTICDTFLGLALGQLLGNHNVSMFVSLLRLVFTTIHKVKPPLSCESFMRNVSTVIVPTNAYLELSLLPLQLKYFLASMHAIENEELRPTKDAVREMREDTFAFLLQFLLAPVVSAANNTDVKLRTLRGLSEYKFHATNVTHQLSLNGAVFTLAGASSLTAGDGVIHVIDVADNPRASDFVAALDIKIVPMVPRRALYAMHFSTYVRELHFRKLGHYIDGTTTNQTIVLDKSDRDNVPDDDAVDEFEETSEDAEFSSSSFSSRQGMLYRFLEGAIDVTSDMGNASNFFTLATSLLCLNKRIGSCYPAKFSVTREHGQILFTINDQMVSDPTPVWADGDNVIYVLDKDYETPGNFKHTIADLLSDGASKTHLSHILIDRDACLQTIKYLNTFGLNSLDDNHRGYTVFLPCGVPVWESNSVIQRETTRGLWKNLGLVVDYLEAHPKLLKKIVSGMFIEDLIYSDFGIENPSDTLVSRTLKGDAVVVRSRYADEVNHLIKINETTIMVPRNSDVLFNQGVVHITSGVLWPDNFEIPTKDLIQTIERKSSQFSFLSLLDAMPLIREALDMDSTAKYSFLVPTPDSLKAQNVTQHLAHLDQFLQLHLIPHDQLPILQQCMLGINGTHIVKSNHTYGVYECLTNRGSGETRLRLLPRQEATKAGKEPASLDTEYHVNIINKGCTSQHRNSSCVFLIDQPVSLEWLEHRRDFLHIHIGWISVAIGVIIGVILFGVLTTGLIVCLSSGDKKKRHMKIVSPETLFAPNPNSFMRVTSDEDALTGYNEHGYETDDDMFLDEREELLPLRGSRKLKRKGYGAISTLPMGPPVTPKDIRANPLKSQLQRNRYLPAQD